MGRDHDPFEETSRLLLAASRGDSDSLDALIRRYETRFLRRIQRQMGARLRSFTESRDLLQEFFVDLVKDYDPARVRTEQEFLRWANRVAGNTVQDVVRRQRARALDRLTSSVLRRGTPDSRVTDPGSAIARIDEQDRVTRALKNLPENYRRVIELRDIEGLPYREVAGRMDATSEEAARKLYGRAMARLTTEVSRTLPPDHPGTPETQ